MTQLSVSEQRRNFRLGVINGAFFRIADVFIDTEMVFTWFLVQLGVSNFLIGLVSPIRLGSSFLLQILVSGHLQRKPYKMAFYRGVSVFRCSVLLAFALLLTLVSPQSSWLTAAFFAALIIYSTGAGLVSIPFMDMVAKMVPPRKRGAFFSQRNFWGGILALGASSVIGFILSEPDGLHFPLNAAVLFGVAALFYGLTAITWNLAKEPPGSVIKRAVPWTMQFRRGIRALTQHKAYRMYALVRLATLLAQWAAPFYIVYATKVLNAPAYMMGLYLGARTTAMILSNLIWGRMSDRHGNRRLLVISSAIGLGMPIIALLLGYINSTMSSTTWLVYAFGAVFVASGVFNAGSMIGISGYQLDIAPVEERPLYLAFTNTLFGLLRFTSAAGGLIVDWAGFNMLLWISVIFFGLALLLAIMMIEPRNVKATT